MNVFQLCIHAFEYLSLFVCCVDDDDISISVTSNILESYPTAGQLPRPKLLQFWENRRPPYWGTWRKKSQSIRPRNPFGADEVSKYIFV
jgi:hypothetical protein